MSQILYTIFLNKMKNSIRKIKMSMPGRLDIMLGCMFSGKSSALLRKLSQLESMGQKVLYINHSIDNRENIYSTHCKLTKNRELSFDSIKLSDFNDFEKALDYDVIGIDEAQFFDESILIFVDRLLRNHKYIIIVGLDGTFERRPFGFILELIPLADNVAKLHAYCRNCYNKSQKLTTAIFSHRIVEDRSTNLVGAADSYIPVCRECYEELNSSI
jgi:thymidine kinase